MEQEARPTEDTLFLALTRPALWLGVPLEATLLIAMATVLTLLLTSNPLYAIGLGGALLAAARLIVRTDYNMFRLIFLWGRTKARCRNRDYWAGSSYSPLLSDGLKRRGFTRG